MKIVIAGTYAQFQHYVNENGLSPRDAVHVDEGNHRKLQGLRLKPEDIVRVGTWFERKDIDRLEVQLRALCR